MGLRRVLCRRWSMVAVGAMVVGMVVLSTSPARAVGCGSRSVAELLADDRVTGVFELGSVADSPGLGRRTMAMAVTRYWGEEPNLDLRRFGGFVPPLIAGCWESVSGGGHVLGISAIDRGFEVSMVEYWSVKTVGGQTVGGRSEAFFASMDARFGPPVSVESRPGARLRAVALVWWPHWLIGFLVVAIPTIAMIVERRRNRSAGL